jgi:predicted translin family RNA/ssDNA-binding protein
MKLDTKYLGTLKTGLHSYALIRRDVIKHSGDALHHAKRAIFAMHRGNMKEAAQKLKESEKIFKTLHTKHKKNLEIKKEGAYKAGLEEYVEAMIFHQFLTKGNIGKITALPIAPDVYLAGLCDVPGELYRYAIRAATKKDRKTVEACRDMAGMIAGELIEFNLTSYLRTKSDQAKQAAHKLEIVVYEMSLRG